MEQANLVGLVGGTITFGQRPSFCTDVGRWVPWTVIAYTNDPDDACRMVEKLERKAAKGPVLIELHRRSDNALVETWKLEDVVVRDWSFIPDKNPKVQIILEFQSAAVLADPGNPKTCQE